MTERPVPEPNCPPRLRVNESVPMAYVADVDRSMEFYALLGFACDSRFSDARGTNWGALSTGRARLFLSRASGRVVAPDQAVLFYMYSADVHGLRAHLLAAGVPDAGPIPWEAHGTPKPVPPGATVFEVAPRFYMPEGELRIHDPDGYVILVGQRGC